MPENKTSDQNKNSLMSSIEGPQPAYQVALDIVKRGLIVAPVFIAISAAIWGAAGAAGSGYGLAIVLFNFWLSAAIIAGTSRISLALLMVGVMCGFLLRMGIIFIAVWPFRNADWMNLIALGLTIIITHLGLLVWEMRYISASLAYPGLKPRGNKKNKRSGVNLNGTFSGNNVKTAIKTGVATGHETAKAGQA